MNIADLMIVLVLLVSVVQAAISGFFQEAFAIAGAVFGYIVAAWQYQRLTSYLSPYISSRWLAEIVAFLLIFSLVLVLAGLLGRTVRWLIKEVGLSGIDRFLGALLGLVRGALLVAIVLVGHDGVRSQLALAARIVAGAVFSGSRTGGNLDRAVRVAVAVLSRTGLFTARASC